MLKRVGLSMLFLGTAILSMAINPYLFYGEMKWDMETAKTKLSESLTNNGFEILGNYNAANNPNLYVLAFTSKELINAVATVEDRGLLAAPLKASIIIKEGKPNLTLLNPEYIFTAYLRSKIDDPELKETLMEIDEKVKSTLGLLTNTPFGFGGDVSEPDLKIYRYMFGMERFNNPVKLNTFESFDAGIKTIQANLVKEVGNTKLIYQIVLPEKEMAVFGIALLNTDKGEPHFLPIIGVDNVAALPYEIILQGKEATMLHGRYRIDLHWPELTMGTFSKIMSTPGNIEDMLKAISK